MSNINLNPNDTVTWVSNGKTKQIPKQKFLSDLQKAQTRLSKMAKTTDSVDLNNTINRATFADGTSNIARQNEYRNLVRANANKSKVTNTNTAKGLWNWIKTNKWKSAGIGIAIVAACATLYSYLSNKKADKAEEIA